MKRLLSGLMAALMLTALLPSAALAAKIPTRDEAAQVLSALNIMSGNEKGDLMLASPVTRAEFTKMLVAAAPFGDGVGGETGTSPYPDVPRTHWAASYIQAAVDNGLVRGDLYGNFNPGNTITLAEGVTMVLRLLGYQDADYSGAYPTGQMALYRTLKLNDGVPTTNQGSPLSREDCLYLFYNLLTAKNKSGQVHLNVLKPADKLVNAAGEIDSVALVNSAMDGPIVASMGWETKIPFDIANAKVYRGGALSTPAAVLNNDVVYWSKSMGTLWVYNNRITGSIQAVTPASAPTTVTLAGKNYSIEAGSAAYDLSDLGKYQVGDTVTLLLGRDNKVAAVLSSSAAAQTGGDVVGFITSVSKEIYQDAAGKDYTASTIHLLGTDGNSYSYRWDNASAKAGSLVQVTTVNGELKVKSLSSGSLEGKVSSDGKRLGDYTFATDVEILDYYGENAVRIFPDRLKGVTIPRENVRYYLLNSQREISKLILKDVTGDTHQYGVLTSATEVNNGMTVMGSYVYDVGGATGTVGGTGGGKVYNVKTGPFMMKTSGGALERMVNLSKVSISSVSGNEVVADNQKYTIWDSVAVYEIRDGHYYLTNLDAVSGGGYTLSGYYDKAQSDGGCIRVILAQG